MTAVAAGTTTVDAGEFTMRCEVRGSATVLTVDGALDAGRCQQLWDGLELARTLRARGPIIVDLDLVDRASVPALLVLLRAAMNAERTARTVRLGPVPPAALGDPQVARLVQALWPSAAAGGGPHPPGRRRNRRP